MADANIKAEAEVVVNTSGVADAVKRATDKADAVTKKSRRANADETAKAAKAQERLQEKQIRDNERYQQKMLRQRQDANAKAIQAEEREHQRYQDRLTQRHRDEVAKRAQAEIEAERKSIQTRQKLARETLKNVREKVVSGAAGALAAGSTAVSTARGIAGVQDTATRVQLANQFHETIAGAAMLSGFDPVRAGELERRAAETSKKNGLDPMSVSGGLGIAQEEFNSLEYMSRHLEEIAKVAAATGTDFEALTTTMLQARQQLDLSDEDFSKALNVLVAAQDKGAVSVSSFAQNYQELFGVFASSLHAKGLEGFKTVVGVAQTAKTAGRKHAETATMGVHIGEEIALPDKQKKLGAMLGMSASAVSKLQLSELVDKLAVNKEWAKAGKRKDAFPNIIAMQAMETLVRQRQAVMAGDKSAVDLKGMESLTPEQGAASVEAQYNRRSKDGSFQFAQKAAEAFDGTLQQLDTMNNQLLGVNEAGNWLEEKLGSLALWADSIKAGGIGVLAAKLFGSVGGGGAAAAGAAEAGGVAVGTAASGGLLTTLGTGVAAAGAGAVAGAVGVGSAVGIGAGMGIDALVELVLKEKLSHMLARSVDNVDSIRAAQSGGGLDSAGARLEKVEGELKRSNRHLERIANGVMPPRPTPHGTGNRGAR